MLNQVKYMIIFNGFVGFLYFFANFDLWHRVNYWVLVDVGSEWGPFFVSSKYLGVPTTPSYSPIYDTQINSPFLIFFFLLAINLFFIIRIARSKETKQTPS